MDIKRKPIFDIVAGTSIGAINAAVLVSYVVENQTYEGFAERLVDFWKYLSKESTVESNPFFKQWWDYWHSLNGEIASGESARRYYSAKIFHSMETQMSFLIFFNLTIYSKFYDSKQYV